MLTAIYFLSRYLLPLVVPTLRWEVVVAVSFAALFALKVILVLRAVWGYRSKLNSTQNVIAASLALVATLFIAFFEEGGWLLLSVFQGQPFWFWLGIAVVGDLWATYDLFHSRKKSSAVTIRVIRIGGAK